MITYVLKVNGRTQKPALYDEEEAKRFCRAFIDGGDTCEIEAFPPDGPTGMPMRTLRWSDEDQVWVTHRN